MASKKAKTDKLQCPNEHPDKPVASQNISSRSSIAISQVEPAPSGLKKKSKRQQRKKTAGQSNTVSEAKQTLAQPLTALTSNPTTTGVSGTPEAPNPKASKKPKKPKKKGNWAKTTRAPKGGFYPIYPAARIVPFESVQPIIESFTTGPINTQQSGIPRQRRRPNDRKMNETRERVNDSQRSEKVSTGIAKYGMKESLKRLHTVGFHPDVTTRTPIEVAGVWLKTMTMYAVRPTRDAFIKNQVVQGNHRPSKKLTRALLIFRENGNRLKESCNTPDTEGQDINGTVKTIEGLLASAHVGALVAEQIFADGCKTVESFALSSTGSWKAIAANASVWDFYSGAFRCDGHSGIFVVVTPEYTVGEILDSRVSAESYRSRKSTWQQNVVTLEEDIFRMADAIYTGAKPTSPFWMLDINGLEDGPPVRRSILNTVPEESLRIIRSLLNLDHVDMWGVNQFTASPKGHPFVPQLTFAATQLQSLMQQISEQPAGIRILYFQKTPMLDRRMLAIILKACPNVVMLGVYGCPLIHFGDVNCILDLIHEINIDRRRQGKPTIHSFDFFPHYNTGTPYLQANAATYGLTWGPKKLDVVQRGFFGILLKAFMKAKAMNIGLLFSPGKAFLEYLSRVPNYPWAVPGFLDGLYRYLEIDESKPDAESQRRMAIYDFLKPVRLGLEFYMESDWPKWYMQDMGKHLVFCSSCGYKTFQEFFSAESRHSAPHTRICAGCILQCWLDEETDHLKHRKRGALDKLCPDWDRSAFNHDAPILDKGKGLIQLQSTKSVRPAPPGLVVGANGFVRQPRYQEPLVRDNKIHFDSLRGLPKLSDLMDQRKSTKDNTWGALFVDTDNVDMMCRAIRQLRENYPENGYNEEVKPFVQTRTDGAMPDHFDELQLPRDQIYFPMSYNCEAAYEFDMALQHKGW